jgi:hypothetical protein
MIVVRQRGLAVRGGGEERLRRTVAVPTHLRAQLALDLDG